MNKHKSTQQHDLAELCALFSSADEWGRARILEAARRQAPAASTLPALTLVTAGSIFDQRPHRLDNPVDFRPLALVRQSVHAEKP